RDRAGGPRTDQVAVRLICDTEPRLGDFSEWEVTLVDLMSRWVSYELQHREARARLERQNDKLDRFAGIVSHDLRNPLNVVSGSIELAAETGDLDHLDRAADAVGRMELLIENLLTLARAGDEIDDPVPVHLPSFVAQCRDNVVIPEARVRIETTRSVYADETRLGQLFENLFRNAVEHGSTSPPSQAQGNAADDDEGVTIVVGDLPDGFYVADDGPGIPEDERERVFESGYTTSNGSGIGLAIVAEVAGAHGWDVSLTDQPGGGARFEFEGVSRPPSEDEEPEA
ncbi:MAG: sensor histidine kinase, partial [Halobellus sp.]